MLKLAYYNKKTTTFVKKYTMKTYTLLAAFVIAMLFPINISAQKSNKFSTPKNSEEIAVPDFKLDSAAYQKYAKQFNDSLQLNQFKLPKFGKEKYRFSLPNDSASSRRFYVPPTNKHPNPYFKNPALARDKARVIRVGPDNMPVYVPEGAYIPQKKIEIEDNMPVLVPKGFNKEADIETEK